MPKSNLPKGYPFTERKSFVGVVQWATAHILQELIRGRMYDGVYYALNTAIQWNACEDYEDANS